MPAIQYSTPSLVAVATGVVGSAWAAGNIASLSLIGIPAARGLSNTAQVWHGLYTTGKALMPKVAVTVALSYAYAAYASRSRGSRFWVYYAGAAGLVISIVPFTLVFMNQTNDILTQAAVAGTAVSNKGIVDDLVVKWGFLNLARSALPLAGAVTGLITFLRESM